MRDSVVEAGQNKDRVMTAKGLPRPSKLLTCLAGHCKAQPRFTKLLDTTYYLSGLVSIFFLCEAS